MTHGALDAAFAVLARTIVPEGVLQRSWPLTGGVSAEVSALEVASPLAGVRRLVVRRHGLAKESPAAAAKTTREFELLKALHPLGLRVPEPLWLDTSNRLLPSPFLVTEYVDGTTTVTEADLPAALRQMAEFLAHLHRIDVRAPVWSYLPRREDPIGGALGLLADAPAFDAVRDVLHAIERHPASECLVHGDFWPGNLLWVGGELAAVIDWEDAAIGPALSDVACCRVEVEVAFGGTAAEDFTRHYLSAGPVDVTDLPLWDLYVGSAALAAMHRWRLPPDVETARRACTAAFVARAADALVRGR